MNYDLKNMDCVEGVSQMADCSVDMAVYSPPFADVFVYSDDIRDMGNCSSIAEFITHYSFLLKEMVRVMKPGRIVCVHCSDLPTSKFKDGFIGIRDFSGDLIKAHVEAGFTYHSRVTVWKNPVTEMQRTKALGLLYKQLRKDSTRSRQGLSDYVLVFRAPGENAIPVTHNADEFDLDQWQSWASPVWMDINQTNTLNVRHGSRDSNDERHVCPLQLDLIERCIRLWSNPGELILSPFTGIGSEGYTAIKCQRRFVGFELKPSYYKTAMANLANAGAIGDLFLQESA
jgi:DNA modification methylase